MIKPYINRSLRLITPLNISRRELTLQFFRQSLAQSEFNDKVVKLAGKIRKEIEQRGYHISFDEQAFLAAAGMCVYAHRHQKRKVDQRPYADHPIMVVEREVELLHVLDQEELIAGFLHDVVEDTAFRIGDIQFFFGGGVANLVEGMTKLAQLEGDKLIDERNIDKFLGALRKDIRVLRLKMVDRGCNLLDADQLSDESRLRNAQEALDLYVPLGVLAGFIKAARHLADIALWAQNKNKHEKLNNFIWATNAVPAFTELIGKLRNAIESNRLGINATVLSKPRTAYELAQIAELRGKDDWQPHDVLMMQVIVDTDEDCFKILKVIHALGNHPADKYWRDYIHDPKTNGYQSLHTAVWIDGVLIRFQIRTHEMQRMAEEGVLYKSYKEQGKFRQPKLPWLRRDWLQLILSDINRREKILLIKSLSHVRPTSVIISFSDGTCEGIEALLPPNISPLEALMIINPAAALKLKQAYLPGVSNQAGHSLPVAEPIVGGVGHICFKVGDELTSRNYAALLNNPMAKFSYLALLRKNGNGFCVELGQQILEPHLGQQLLGPEDLASFTDDEGFSRLLCSLAKGEFEVRLVMDWLRSHLFGDDKEVLALERLSFAITLGTQLSLLPRFSRWFPTDSYNVRGNMVSLAVSIMSTVQQRQFERLVTALADSGMSITRETIIPPIIDGRCLAPKDVFYVHRAAEKAREAIAVQEGSVYDLTLDPPLLFGLPVGTALFADFDERYAEVIRTARILFFSGADEQLNDFRQRLLRFVPPGFRDDFPIIVLMRDRQSGDDVSNIVGSLLGHSQVSYEGYFSGFFLKHLRQQADAIR